MEVKKVFWIIEALISSKNHASDFSRKYIEAIDSTIAALNHQEWVFKFNQYGSLCGAAHTKHVPNRLVTKILMNGPEFLQSREYFFGILNEPSQLVLIDFWAEAGQGKAFIEHLRDQLKPQHENIIYFRIKNGKRIAKLLTRNDATTFMRSSQAARVDEGIPFLQTAAARDFYLPTYNTQMAFAQRVGEMALLMVHAPGAAVSPLKPVLERIQTCAKLQQHKLYESSRGTPTGLVNWAWLTSKRLRTDSFDTNALQAFEWSEGPHLAVVDVVMSAETEAAVWADLAGLLYPDEDIWLLCQVGARTFFKKWAKKQRHELLTSPQARAAIVFGTWHDITGEPSCVQ